METPNDVELRERLLEAARLSTVGRLLPSVAHEMSTPLAAIALRAESLEHILDPERPGSAEKTRRYLQAIGDETRRVRDLLAALREFAGHLDPSPSKVDLGSLCRSAGRLVHHEAMRGQVEVTIEVDDALPAVRGQRLRLGQAILCLLLNGVHASPTGARVSLEARRVSDADALIRVTDEGEGLGERVRERLFEPFASGRAPDRGLGLGLMATRLVAEAHGGVLIWESTPGRGSCFTLRLPAEGRREEAETDART